MRYKSLISKLSVRPNCIENIIRKYLEITVRRYKSMFLFYYDSRIFERKLRRVFKEI